MLLISSDTRPSAVHRTTALAAIVWAVTLCVLWLAAERRVPRPDEGHFAASAFNLAHRGSTGTTTLDPDASGLPRIQQKSYWTMPLYMLVEAAWFRLFPATAFSSRVLNLVLLFPIGYALYIITFRLTSNRTAAILATAILFSDYAFMYATISARPDLLCLTFGLGAIAVYIRWRDSHFDRALYAAAALLAVSALAHPNALLHLVALGAFILIYDRRRLSLGRLVRSALVCILVLIPYFAYALGDVEAFYAQMKGNAAGNGRISSSSNPITLLTQEGKRYADTYGLTEATALPKLKSIALGLYVAAVVCACLLRSVRTAQGVGALLVLWAAYLLTQSVFNQKLSVYLSHILPVYAALLAVVVLTIPARPWIRTLGLLTILLGIAIQLGGMFWSSRTSENAQLDSVAHFLDVHAKAAPSINGPSTIAFALNFDQRLVEDHTIGISTGKTPAVVIVDPNYEDSFSAMRQRRPTVFEAVQKRLDAYHPVFRTSRYTVYFSPEFCAQTPICRLPAGWGA